MYWRRRTGRDRPVATLAIATLAVVSLGLAAAGVVAAATLPTTAAAHPAHSPAAPVAALSQVAAGAPSAAAAPPVAALRGRIAPDVLVLAAHSLTPAQQHTAESAVGATAALLVDAGRVRLGAGSTGALGIDPSTFRAWTPAGTAESDPLWASVARGDVAVAQAVAKALAVPLGGEITVRPPVSAAGVPGVVERVGAYATTALPGVGLVVDTAGGRTLGLTHDAGLLLAAAGKDPVVEATELRAALGSGVAVTAVRIPTTNGALQWVAPAFGPITSPFGLRPDPNHPGHTEFHAGIDIGAPLGATIYAAAAGVVQYAGPASGFGQEVILSHPGGITTVYGHMEKILVTSGAVRAGQPIALVGAEGDATGPHLHFEVHIGPDLTDPLAWLKAHGVQVGR